MLVADYPSCCLVLVKVSILGQAGRGLCLGCGGVRMVRLTFIPVTWYFAMFLVFGEVVDRLHVVAEATQHRDIKEVTGRLWCGVVWVMATTITTTGLWR